MYTICVFLEPAGSAGTVSLTLTVLEPKMTRLATPSGVAGGGSFLSVLRPSLWPPPFLLPKLS